jgi:hypothetical protein
MSGDLIFDIARFYTMTLALTSYLKDSGAASEVEAQAIGIFTRPLA